MLDNNFAYPTLLSASRIHVEVTQEYIDSCSALENEYVCSNDLLEQLNVRIECENAIREKSHHLAILKELPNICVVGLMSAHPHLAVVTGGDKSGNGNKPFLTYEEKMELPVVYYNADGDNAGVWESANRPLGLFGSIVERYKPGATDKDKKEIFSSVKGKLRTIYKCVIPYYAAMNNCIYDVLHKKAIPFSPDLVFTAKSHINFNAAAVNPFIYIEEDGTTWDVISWLNSLGTPEFVEQIKDVIQAVLLPLAPRGKSVWFYSPTGNNGKGTIAALLRNLVTDSVTVNIPLSQFGEPFGLAELPKAMAIITDENEVDSFNKAGMEKFKAVVTGDAVTINKKYENPYKFYFNGLVLECMNSLVETTDKSNSFYRRLHIIKFSECFTGKERRYIKQRLIYRTDVLEFIAKMVLQDMEYKEAFTETPMIKDALSEYISSTNSVAEYLDTILPKAKWNLLPAKDFLYEGYKTYCKKTNPNGKIKKYPKFINSVKDYISKNPDWEWTDCCRSDGYIDGNVTEPLLLEYEMEPFRNRLCYVPYDPTSQYSVSGCLKEKYSGLKRKGFTKQQATVTNNP